LKQNFSFIYTVFKLVYVARNPTDFTNEEEAFLVNDMALREISLVCSANFRPEKPPFFDLPNIYHVG